jgi:crotonobetainyl-CoA:carnitine CoA-transferase CaiB-like acyl-CoA transferase
MTLPFEGIRVLEVAAWTFVPAAGAIMADLGADVIKIEPPTGDPQRGLQNMLNLDTGGPNPFVEIPNRGKRSVTLDLANPTGREALLKIAATSDVFLTSYLPEVREKLGIDLDDIRAVNPNIIYVRGSGWGSIGPMRNVGGYDLAAAWASSGLAYRLTPPGGEPEFQPPAFYDLQGSNTIAGAVAMALLKRERTGEASVVDVSLLAVGLWTMGPDIVSAPYFGDPKRTDRTQPGNVIANSYKTADDRWLYLVCLQSDRFWPEVCTVIERTDLIHDVRYENATVRHANRVECVAELDKAFATRTLADWKQRFDGFSGVWAPVQSYTEIHEHEQIQVNSYLPEITDNNGLTFRIVAPPMQFDDQPTAPRSGAPEIGADTEFVLVDAGLDWDEISDMRERGAFG